MPTPGKDELRKKFISRCMGEERMKNEFPDVKQRAAVCFSKWKKEHKASLANLTDAEKFQIYLEAILQESEDEQMPPM